MTVCGYMKGTATVYGLQQYAKDKEDTEGIGKTEERDNTEEMD